MAAWEPTWNGQRIDALCESLQDNDPEVTEVSTTYHESRRIGSALLGNTQVTLLGLNLNDLFHERDDHFGLDHGYPLLRCVRENHALNSLYLHNNTSDETRLVDTSELAACFFTALCEPPSLKGSITELNVARWEDIFFSQEAFSLLLKTTKALKRFTFGLPTSYCHGFGQWFVDALKTNQSLEYLCFGSMNGATWPRSYPMDFGSTIQRILVQMQKHPQLCELAVRCFGNQHAIVAGVAVLLRKLPLRYLELEHMRLDADSIECLIEALEVNGTLATLLLHDNHTTPYPPTVHRATNTVLTSYLMSEVNEPKNSSLTSLCYSGHLDLLLDALLDLSSTATTSQTGIVERRKVGSSLRELEICYSCEATDVVRFIAGYSQHAAAIKVETLKLHNVQSAGASCAALIRFIPSLVHVKELVLESVSHGPQTIPPELVQALKQNGSLHQVSISCHGNPHHVVFPNYPKSAVVDIQAYCDRNRMLPLLLPSPSPYASHMAASEVACASTAKVTEMIIPLVPSLFVAAIAAKKTRAKIVLMGLLGAVGQFRLSRGVRDGKRL